MRPALVLSAAVLLVSAWLGCPAYAASTSASPLSAPGDFSLLPPPATDPAGALAGSLPGASPGLFQHGVVSQSFGSDGFRSSAVELDSGPLPGGARAFLQAATGQGPRYHDLPRISGSSVALGVQAPLPYGSLLSIEVAGGRDQFSRGGRVSPLP